jgi:hypothetical protein
MSNTFGRFGKSGLFSRKNRPSSRQSSSKHSYIDDDTNAHSVTTAKQVSDYMSYLFKFLGKYCFIKGSFVIADNNSKLYNFLKYTDTAISSVLPIVSHTIYKNNSTEPLREINLQSVPFTINCASDINCRMSRICGIIKWYRFVQNGNTFIFIKPEREPTLTIAHAYNATQRYWVKPKNEDCLKHRREDCEIVDHNCDFEGKPLPYRMFPIVIIDGTENPVSETYNRQGDEAFIIQPVSEFIIDTISDATDITFQYDNFDDIMTLTTKTKGGKTKKIQKKCKTMRKKNKRIKKLSRKR